MLTLVQYLTVVAPLSRSERRPLFAAPHFSNANQ